MLISLEVQKLSNQVVPIFPRSILNWVTLPLDQHISKDPVTQLLLRGLQNLLWSHPELLLIYMYFVIKIPNMP